MRLFSEDSAKDAKFPIVPEGISEVYVKGWNDAIDAIIDNAPTVEERPKGKWVLKETDYDDGGNNLYECTNCHHSDTHSGSTEVPYCWYCGADMRGRTGR